MLAELVNPVSGYYGKTPATGDFIKYNLPRAFIEPWDDWLQNALSSSREHMGEEWLDAYLTSPVYRFILTAGICGEHAWRGVLMPSVDRVGRYFPMTIAAPLDTAENPFQHIQEENAWFSQAESLILSVLEDDFTTDALNQSLKELDSLGHSNIPAEINPPVSNNRLLDTLAIRQRLPEDEQSLQLLYPRLMHSLLLETGFAYSLWRTTGSERVAPSLLLSQGLPPVQSVIAMLDGNWQRWGWTDNQPALALLDTPDDEQVDPWDQ